MELSRRDFIRTTAATAASVAAADRFGCVIAAQTLPAPGADPFAIELAKEALNAARDAGRVVRGRAHRPLP